MNTTYHTKIEKRTDGKYGIISDTGEYTVYHPWTFDSLVQARAWMDGEEFKNSQKYVKSVTR